MKKKVLKPFDLEKAKNGAEVCTRDGKKARIICYDRKTNYADEAIVALVEVGVNESVVEELRSYTVNGEYWKNQEKDIDLMLVEYEEEQTQFKPFDKVLVRDSDDDYWVPSFFAYYTNDDDYPYADIFRNGNKQCIPFEGNEKLLNTKDKPE